MREEGYRVRVVDQFGSRYFCQREICHEFVLADLRDRRLAEDAVRGAAVVLLFAADMGGMGFISGNDASIMTSNTRITLNVIEACRAQRVKILVSSSSACVYPVELQAEDTLGESTEARAVRLTEHLAWPAHPQDGYGLEKLYGEELARYTTQASPQLHVRVARFHNVYGPLGTWRGGREKAPAALLRKALALKHLKSLGADSGIQVALWGPGTQRRSFLYIDDAVRGVLALIENATAALLSGSASAPRFAVYNIGSEEDVSLRELALLSCDLVGLPTSAVSETEVTGPVGVHHRSSDNAFAKSELRWTPQVPLAEGLQATATWIESQLEAVTASSRGLRDSSAHNTRSIAFLASCLESQKVAAGQQKRFAVFLPVTSRGQGLNVIATLRKFLRSLAETGSSPVDWHYDIHFAVDEGDTILDSLNGDHDGEVVDLARLAYEEIPHLSVSATVRRFSYPPGSICRIWRDLCHDAVASGCDYFALMGDDVELETPGWSEHIHEAFANIAIRRGLPFGFGCVAFHDRAFPAFPTFPVLHRLHMEVFGGVAFPSDFVNQHADPFLFQVYSRFGATAFLADTSLHNRIGGAGDARYKKCDVWWTGHLLTRAVQRASEWLVTQGLATHLAQPLVSLDVVVPSFRADRVFLSRILALERPSDVVMMIIIQLDNPQSPDAQSLLLELQAQYKTDPWVRIRMNPENIGAGPTRNQGLKESSADWVLLLDDDVIPSPKILHAYARAIREHPNATGFIGPTILPVPRTARQAGVHMAGISYFWTIASKLSTELELPWGVTANICIRRDAEGFTRFRDVFPKTGGGEDIDLCLQLRRWRANRIPASEGFVSVPDATADHPYWDNGECHYRHFFGWSTGDGHLIDLYPELTYRNLPDLAEALLLMVLGAAALAAAAGASRLLPSFWSPLLPAIPPQLLQHLAFRCVLGAGSLIVSDLAYEIMSQGRQAPLRELTWTQRMLAIPEALIVRTWSEAGRLYGHFTRGRLVHNLFWRFNWFGFMWPGAVQAERRQSRARWLVRLAFLSVSFSLFF